ncbi:MAG: hypothetical protein LBC60_10865 [Spirochaetaceae bacterium]|jgi:hypothetical protein|nr:hypothetical protein [Spirochaetaceae bacterium]
MKKIRHIRNRLPRRGIIALFAVSLGLLFLSCDQHPIFYDISHEVAPKDPYIPGSPTKIVANGNTLYVSNGKGLYQYQQSSWSPIDKPSGAISDIAFAGSLYCIIENKSLYRYNNNQWEAVPLSGYTYLQNIYGSNTLYICASNAGSSANVYTILSLSGGGSPQVIKSGAGEDYFLRGAAGNYFATTSGIYSSGGGTPISGSTGHTIMGLISVGSGIAASTKGGYILYGSGSSVTAWSFGLTFDRAMAIYTTRNGTKLLLVGVYTKGFYEIVLNGNSYSTSHYPGEGTYDVNTTAHDYAQYRSSLGVQSLTGLYQAQNGTLFASTQQKGLWAYQLGDEGWQWNAY